MQTVSIKSRTSAPLVLSFIDEADAAVVVSTATEIRFGIKDAMLAGVAPLITKTLTGGGLTRTGESVNVAFTTPDWNLLPPGRYVMDLDFTVGSDNWVSDTYELIVEPRAAIA